MAVALHTQLLWSLVPCEHALAVGTSLKVTKGSARDDGLAGAVTVGDCGAGTCTGAWCQPPGCEVRAPSPPLGNQARIRSCQRAWLSESQSVPQAWCQGPQPIKVDAPPWQSSVRAVGMGPEVPTGIRPHHMPIAGSSCYLFVSVAGSLALSGGIRSPRTARLQKDVPQERGACRARVRQEGPGPQQDAAGH